ncbi:MAG TPA: chemotaxis protein CheB [Nevskia sp.]|nr:chemotaxis protein CheB [Nevskia sp.]
MADQDNEESKPIDCLNIAVLGASAGGVEALSTVVAHLPDEPAFAAVVLMHLAADQESQLPEILAKQARWPVEPIAGGTPLQHGRIYVLTPGTVASVRDRRLLTMPRAEGLSRPIDEFMTAAADEEEVRAAAVVLSGMGSDGVAGAREIKAGGGRVIAQEPRSALHGGMPEAVIAEQLADEVLAPEAVGPALLRYFQSRSERSEVNDAHVEEALAQIKRGLGVNLGYYKAVNVRRRLARRAFLQAGGDLGAYMQRLEDDREELKALRDDLLIGVTGFFRDPEFVGALEQHVLPELLQGSQEIRIWVPACSTGEEAYSIALLLHHTLESAGLHRKMQVFGSDINDEAIRKARIGRYDAAAVASIPPMLRERYLVAEEGAWRIAKPVRETCVFATHNLFVNAPFSNVDLVSARNLLIYVRKAAKRHAFEVFSYALRRNGKLLLAPSEAADPELFEDYQPQLSLYRRRQVTRPPLRGFIFGESAPTAVTERPEVAGPSLESVVDRLALARFEPPGFVVDTHGSVVQFRGDTAHLLQPTRGDAALSLAKLIHPDLQVDVRAALMEAVHSKLTVRRERLRFGDRLCTLEVVPVPSGGAERYFLVSVDDRGSTPPLPAPGSPDGRAEDLERYVRVLGDELEQTRAQLKQVVVDYDATGEELRTANEEVLSANEELQSSNEELQEAKRSLEGANADLGTLNQRLQERNEQLSALNDDLGNLIRGIPVPVLMLDRDRCVRYFTPAAAELLGLHESDLGRPLRIDPVFADGALDAPLDEALGELRPVQREIQDANGRWYALHVRAYQTSENRVEGAVCALQDIHGLKVSLEAANSARAEAERANAAKNDFLALVSHELRSPLNVIANWVQLLLILKKDQGADERERRGLDTIHRQCQNLARLIDELLDISRITSGRLVLDLRPVDLAAVVRATVEALEPGADSRKVRLTTAGLSDELRMAGDTRRLQQIVGNILGNALKFTPEGGKVEVSLARIGTVAELAVSDTGIGIGAEELPRVFDRFMQADISKARKYGGMGLGLSIVRSLVEAHGGSVAASSEGPGKGARFLVRLPLSPGMHIDNGPPAGPGAPAALSLKGVRLLVVDDEPVGREAITQVLLALGAEVQAAGSGIEALDLLERERFDALISDVAMPEMTGYELMQTIRKNEGARAAPGIYAVALTGFASIGERDEALAAGFDAHFAKPPNIEEIAARIAAAAAARALRSS